MPYTADLTEAEVNYFFNVDIGIPGATMVKLHEEGTERLETLVKFNSEDVEDIADALRKPGGLVLSIGNARASMIPAPRVRFGATQEKQMVRLVQACRTSSHIRFFTNSARRLILLGNPIVASAIVNFNRT